MKPECQASPAPCETRLDSLMWCMAKTMAAAEQLWPSSEQTSAICESVASSPPSAAGIWMDMSRSAIIASTASRGSGP